MGRFLKTVLALALLLMLLAGCAQSQDEYRDFVFFGMDTYVTIRLARTDGSGGFLSEEYLTEVSADCEGIVAELEAVLSAHDADSELYSVNASGESEISVSDTLRSALSEAYQAAELTGGAYDFTLGGLINLWNVAGGGPVPAQEEINAALAHIGFDKIELDGNTVVCSDAKVQFDLGGIGKGIAADALIQHLLSTDVKYGLISVGGNIGVFGEKADGSPYKVGIKDPNHSDGVIGYLYLDEGFVSVSGDYERYFIEDGVRYHHILDPWSGQPAESGLHEAAVCSTSGAIADALSTALFVMGMDKSLALYEECGGFEAVLVTDGEVFPTSGLDGGKFELTSEEYICPIKIN